MRYKVRISELRYGEAVVEAENAEQARTVASGVEINWYDSEVTDMTVEPEHDRTYTVVEVCPHCMSEIEMRWNTDAQGFKAFCPVCGKRLMLCDECLHTQGGGCDYSHTTDRCKYNQSEEAPECYIVVHSNYAEGVDTYAFATMERAKKSIDADVETVMANLRMEGYQPVIKERSEDSAEIYVPDSDIYYEWNIVQSHLE